MASRRPRAVSWRDELPGVGVRALALLAAGAALGFVTNAVRANGIALTRYEAPRSCSGTAPEGKPVQVVPASTVSGLCGVSNVVFADVRSPERFAEGHVAGAIHITCTASAAAARDTIAAVRGKNVLVVYGEGVDDARPVAEGLLARAGRSDLQVMVLDGGFGAWSNSGLACSSGPCDDCVPVTKP
jgi:3-mercaptopyruvate sulfurtransferase SseA